MHQSISTMIAISLRENPPRNFEDVSTLIFRKCMAAQYAVRATVNTTLKYTPGELAFGRDMILPLASVLVSYTKFVSMLIYDIRAVG